LFDTGAAITCMSIKELKLIPSHVERTFTGVLSWGKVEFRDCF
jgi:hypothetical protein